MESGSIVGGRFVIESRAGSGGMGTVYRALDRETNAPVAIKILDDDTAALRFAQETSVLGELDHPGIVRYVTHGTTAGTGERVRPFLAMEWLDGEDLATRLTNGPLDIDESLAFGLRVSEALGAAHARGVVHRDVKPSNLFLVGGDPRRAKVLDFGIARRALISGAASSAQRPMTRTGAIVGTIGYMAPEQARGDRDVDARADVFALGCVLFECLTGQPAFAGAHVVAVLAKILLEDAPSASALRGDVPIELDDVVGRMLSKDPDLRPPSAVAVAGLLERLTDAEGARTIEARGARGAALLADREQRLVTIVLAGVSDVAAARALVAPFGGDAFPLAEGTLLVTFAGIRGATDQVARAASCALALRPLASRGVALATGRVETTGDGRMGPIVDRVAAMMKIPNEDTNAIPIDAISAGLLEGRFDVRRGAAEPQGSREPALSLHGPIRERIEPRTLLGRATPCVGRDKELALLDATFRECVEEPVARAVLVTGPAGSGKSRVCHELITRLGAAEINPRILYACGDPIGAGSALGLARQLVRSATRTSHPRCDDPRSALHAHLDSVIDSSEHDLRARLGDMLAELTGVAPPEPGPQLRAARNDASVMSSALRRAFEDWLGALSKRGPLLVVLEDMHWGDLVSVAHVGEALRAHASSAIMVLALARPEVHDLFPRLWSHVAVQELRLPSLTRSAAERLARAAVPEAASDLVGRLVARADGNAFYLEELLRHVVERGDEVALPETILALAQSRIQSLDAESRRVLRVASIFGDAFSVADVEALLGSGGSKTGGGQHETKSDGQREHDRALTAAMLRALVDREVLVHASQQPVVHQLMEAQPVGAQKYAFRHALLREAAYAMLTEEDRIAGHRLAGEWLERIGEPDALLLAEHFERAGDSARAIPQLVRAARLAADAGAFGGGSAIAARGIALGATGEARARLQLVQAGAAAGAGDLAHALECSKQALAFLPRGGVDWFFALATMMQAAVHTSDFSAVPMALNEVLSLDVEPEPIGSYGFAIYMLVDILDTIDQGDLANTLLERAERVEASRSDADPIFTMCLSFARAGFGARRDRDLGEFEGLTQRAQESFRIAPGGEKWRWWVPLIRGVLAIEQGLFEEAEAGLIAAASEFAQDGSAMWAGWCRLHLGWSLILRGRPGDALAIAETLVESPDARHAKALAAYASLELDRFEEADRLSTDAWRGIEHELMTPWVVTLANAVRGRVLLVLGRPAEALACVSAPIHAAGRMISVLSALLLTRLQAARAVGDRALAMETAREARARIERHARSLSEATRRTFLAAPWNAQTLDLARELLD